MKKNYLAICRSLLFSLVMFLVAAKEVKAAYFTLSPASGNYDAGSTFDVVVGISSGEEKVYAADVWINFDSNILSVNGVAAVSSPAFPFVLGDQNIDNDAGIVKIALNPAISSSLDAQPANGSLLTLTLTAVTAGSGNLNFICTDGSINDANIIEPETVSDIIVCSSNQAGVFVIGDSSTSTSTTTSTSEVEPTSVSEELDTTGESGESVSTDVGGSDELPQTGVLMPVLLLTLFGVFGLGGAVLFYRL